MPDNKTTYELTAIKDVYVRKKANYTSQIITAFYNKQKTTSTKMVGLYYYIDGYKGYAPSSAFKCVVKNKPESTTVTLTPEQIKANAEAAKKKEEAEAKKKTDLENQKNVYSEYLDSFGTYNTDVTKSLLANNLTGIYGIPYQFSPEVDRKVDGTTFGRIYSDKIIAKMPLLLLSPGKVNFMSEFRKSDKAKALQQLLHVATDTDDGTSLSSILNKSGRYYTFEYDYLEYYKYVNSMCRSGSRFLGIDKVEVDIGGSKATLGKFNWSNSVNSSFNNYITSKESIAFYVDSASTVDESFSNSTTESQLASKINSFSDIGRELGYLLGVTTGKPKWVDENQLDSALKDISSFADRFANGNELLKTIGSNFVTISTGGKLLFPKIWEDSEFSRSYDINIKLRTPDCDILSWYLNIYVPLCHLIALTAPRQSASANGYNGPFLVRGYHKGLFNCDCGIITSLNITKGKEGEWTLDGLPTVVDIGLQLKDLYQMMFITKGDSVGWFMNNVALMDYIACTCGININKPDIERTLDIYMMLKSDKYRDIPNNIWTKAQQGISNTLMTMYNSVNNILK